MCSAGLSFQPAHRIRPPSVRQRNAILIQMAFRWPADAFWRFAVYWVVHVLVNLLIYYNNWSTLLKVTNETNSYRDQQHMAQSYWMNYDT